MAATQHLAIQPKSDLPLFYGLAHLLIREGWVDESFIASHTNGFEEFRSFVSEFTPERVCEETGIDEVALFHLARTIHEALAGDRALLEQRAATNLKAIGKEAWSRTASALRKGKASNADVLAAAPLIRLEAAKDPKVKEPFLRALTAVRTKTLKESPPPGAKWGTTMGCGMRLEGVNEGPGYLCGMGHVAPLSRRFLVFYTKE